MGMGGCGRISSLQKGNSWRFETCRDNLKSYKHQIVMGENTNVRNLVKNPRDSFSRILIIILFFNWSKKHKLLFFEQ